MPTQVTRGTRSTVARSGDREHYATALEEAAEFEWQRMVGVEEPTARLTLPR